MSHFYHCFRGTPSSNKLQINANINLTSQISTHFSSIRSGNFELEEQRCLTINPDRHTIDMMPILKRCRNQF